MHPSGRVDKLTTPLETTALDVAIDPPDPSAHDVVLIDTPDINLAKAVLRGPLTDATVIYRMRGDVFREMDLWDMPAWKRVAARRIMLSHVDGAIAAGRYLARVYRQETGIDAASVGMPIESDAWPTISHTDGELRAVTLTNAGYRPKVDPIRAWAPVVDGVLEAVGGRWRVCGDGRYADRLADGLDEYDNVEWAGFVDPAAELERSNLMLHPSNLDGQPNAILEGMASNLPVVTNAFGAFTESTLPLQVAHNDDALRLALQQYTDPGVRQAAGAAGRECVAANHSPAEIGRQFAVYFEGVTE